MTTYCLVITDIIQSEGGLPRSARRLDNQQWVLGLAAAPVALQQACGYYAAVDVARPDDTFTLTFDRSITLPGGIPTVTWTQRAKTQAELDAATSSTTAATIEAQARTALTANRTFLALTPPTNAQVLAQTKALTRQVNGLIRLLVDRASLADGTVD